MTSAGNLEASTNFGGNAYGLDGWTQHSTRTQFAMETKAKTAGYGQIRGTFTLAWL